MYADKDRDPKSRDRQISEASLIYLEKFQARDEFKVSHIWEDTASVIQMQKKGSDFKVISITWASLKVFYIYATFFPIMIIFICFHILSE